MSYLRDYNDNWFDRGRRAASAGEPRSDALKVEVALRSAWVRGWRSVKDPTYLEEQTKLTDWGARRKT